MDLEGTRRVAVLSSLLCCASMLTVITLAFILDHWHAALNACVHADCGCLLYARVTSSSYSITGADMSICWFTGAAPLPGLVVALSIAGWYGYRGFVSTPAKLRRAIRVVRAADGSGVRFIVPHSPPGGAGTPTTTPPGSPTKFAQQVTLLVMQAVGCMLLGLFTVSYVAVLTDGILVACKEYRHAVLKTLKASGSLALLVNERLTCPIIFDFLDYMKPDVREVVQDHHWLPGQRHLSTVNTGAALVIAMIAAYSTLVLWFALAVTFARRAKEVTRCSREATRARRSRGQFVGLHNTDL